jgi:hypothetical protein
MAIPPASDLDKKGQRGHRALVPHRLPKVRAILAQPAPEAKPFLTLADAVRHERLGGKTHRTAKHESTERTRALAQAWSEVGASQELIAAQIGIDVDTLKKHYADEISHGPERGVINMATALYERGLRGDVAAMTFFLNKQGKKVKWLEADDSEGPNITVQLDLVRSITSTVQALRNGAAAQDQASLPAARVIEHKPDDDGSDLI